MRSARPPVPRRIAHLAVVSIAAIGLVSCDDGPNTSDPTVLVAQTLTGDFKDTSTMALPPPTFPWEASFELRAEEWCVRSLTIDGVALRTSVEPACGPAAPDPQRALPLGQSDRGAVFGVWAPGRTVAGWVNVSGAGEGGTQSGSWAASQDGPLIIVLLDGVTAATIQLADADHHLVDVLVGADA